MFSFCVSGTHVAHTLIRCRRRRRRLQGCPMQHEARRSRPARPTAPYPLSAQPPARKYHVVDFAWHFPLCQLSCAAGVIWGTVDIILARSSLIEGRPSASHESPPGRCDCEMRCHVALMYKIRGNKFCIPTRLLHYPISILARQWLRGTMAISVSRSARWLSQSGRSEPGWRRRD